MSSNLALPILEYQDEILDCLLHNQVLIVTGEPGCGKSTKLPQFCIDHKALSHKLKTSKISVAVTQPRRVAAIAMAKRVSYERRCKLGTEVGYCIRFEDRSSSKTRIKYLTDGVLLRECMGVKGLSNYNIIILDEAHERSLDTDILMGLLKNHLLSQANFRLIVTSATIDVNLFSKYFSNAPIISVSGRQFDIEILHSACKSDRRVEYVVNAAIRIHLHEGPGDILAFLTGSDECESAKSLCFETLQRLVSKGKSVASMLMLALYGAMSSEEQAKVFKPTPVDCRKVIFSTNISETSITVDGIGFVIDCGYVKQKQFNPANSLDALTVVPISKQQAKQRTGRAGRTQAGKCFRLYSESFYNEQMQENLTAEIHRSNLASIVLVLKSLGIANVTNFAFIEPPSTDKITQAYKLLYYIGALDDTGDITLLGREIVKFPLDPAYSRCLVSSIICKCSSEMLTLVSILSAENIWQNIPKSILSKYEEAKAAQHEFLDKKGDHLTLLKVHEQWKAQGRQQQWCYDNYINFRSMLQTDDIREQLKSIMRTIRVPNLIEDRLFEEFKTSLITNSAKVRFALCIGFYMNAGRAIVYGQEGSYLAVRDNSMLHVDKSASVAILDAYPTWIVYTQLSGTTLAHGTIKMLSKVKSEWLEQIVPKLEKINLNKLLGLPNEKRQRSDSEEEGGKNEQTGENVKEKIEQAKQRYLKRKFN